MIRNKNPEVVVSDEHRKYQWNPALEEIREELTFLKTVRGGRLKNLKYKLQHPQEFLPRSRSSSRSRDHSTPSSPGGDDGSASPQPPGTPDSRSRRRTRSRSSSAFGPAAAMAGVVAGSVAGWSPIERPHDDSDSAKFPTNSPHGGLDSQDGIEVHPDTSEDDRVVRDYSPAALKSPPSQNPDLIPFFENAPPERAPSSHSKRPSSRRSHSSQTPSQTGHR